MNWHPNSARTCLTQLCEERGIRGPRDITFLHWGNNISFGHVRANIVFRVTPPWIPRAPVEREVRTANFLAESGYPAARLSRLWPSQPISTEAGWATAWEWTPGRSGGKEHYGELGLLLARLHALRSREGLFDRAWDVERHPERLAGLESEAKRHHCIAEFKFLRSAHEEQIISSESPLRTAPDRHVLTHGDAHPGNLIVDHKGRSILVDFEYSGTAAPEWDLSEPLLHVTRFGMPASLWTDLRTAYGSAQIDNDTLMTMLRTREVKLASWAMDRALRTGVGIQEALRRARTLIHDDPDIHWTPI
ncbi:phosphotransferase family protein [Lentzea sp. NPDC004789]